MPIVGRPPKPEAERRTGHALTVDWIEVLNVPYDGPVPDPGPLPPQTKRWWRVVSAMPHCALWEASDWQFAIDTAYIHRDWTLSGQGGSELRHRTKILGLTLDDRRALRIRYVDAISSADEEPPPMSIEERRRQVFGG